MSMYTKYFNKSNAAASLGKNQYFRDYVKRNICLQASLIILLILKILKLLAYLLPNRKYIVHPFQNNPNSC